MKPIAPPLNKTSGMPRMGAAFAGWGKKITLIRLCQSVVNGLVEYCETPFTFIGTIQPLSPKMIQLKPEAQRAFEWLQIHCTSGPLNLNTNDRIVYNGSRFKIMADNDYSLNGYIEYHLVKDYQ